MHTRLRALRSSFLVSVVLLVCTTGAVVGAVEPPASQIPADEAGLYVDPARLAEWNDWRFGMFIHWGPWSQTEIGYIWKMTAEDPPGVREKRFDLYRTFNPVNFAPEKWAKAAKAAGMKYVVFVVKHHDGFNNYDTALSDYKITAPDSPWSKQPQPDITRAVVEAFRKEGLGIGLYFSHIDWHHPDGRYFSRDYWDYDESRIDRDPAAWQRFVDYEKGQLRELLTNYGKIDVIWFDINWPFSPVGGQEKITHPKVRQDVLGMIRMMKELQPGIIFNDRGTDIFGGFNSPEQRVPETGLPGSWESNITITNSRGFWFKGENVSAKTPAELVRLLVEIASKGGNFLMNVGPRPDGELSAGEYGALAGVGDWMRVNHECIYGTSRGLFLDLTWGRSTTKGKTIYLQVYDWPADGRLALPGLVTSVKKAYRLADGQKAALAVESLGEDKVVLVGPKTGSESVTVIVLEFAEPPVVKNMIRQRGGEAILLSAGRAEITSAEAKYNFGKATRHGDFIEKISSVEDRFSWTFVVNQPGTYRLEIEYAVRPEQAGSRYAIQVADHAPIVATAEPTASWQGPLIDLLNPSYQPGKGERHDNRWVFKTFDLGSITWSKSGKYDLVIKPETVLHGEVFNLKKIRLVPVQVP